MAEHEVRGAVEECLEEACTSVILGDSDEKVAAAILEHREQRFRLSYILGPWPLENSSNGTGDFNEEDYEDVDEDGEQLTLPDDEIVVATKFSENAKSLRGYVTRIRELSNSVQRKLALEKGRYEAMENANQRQDWIEEFTNALYAEDDFLSLTLDIIDAVRNRFDLISLGEFKRSPSGWPMLWHFQEEDRDAFLKQIRWFSGNHDKQFGRLLTPLVEGIRVRGPFEPTPINLRNKGYKFVLLDGEGLGHSAKEATSISTRVTERFAETDMILLVDSAQSPLQAASLELLRSAGSSGHGRKISIAFTHFDQVRGDNLGTYSLKRDHVRASIGNALSSLQESLGAPVTEILRSRLYGHDFYLSSLDKNIAKIAPGFIKELEKLMDQMQASSVSPILPDLSPIYNGDRLDLILRDAADGFKNPWQGRLGLSYQAGMPKEHWARIKALCRRISGLWDNKEYDGLRPVADFVRQLHSSISLWLNNPTGWTRDSKSEEEEQDVIDAINQQVFNNLHPYAEHRLVFSHLPGWTTAFSFRGKGSSYDRARRMDRIYNAAAPSITSVMEPSSQEFLDEVKKIVREAIEEKGGSLN